MPFDRVFIDLDGVRDGSLLEFQDSRWKAHSSRLTNFLQGHFKDKTAQNKRLADNTPTKIKSPV